MYRPSRSLLEYEERDAKVHTGDYKHKHFMISEFLNKGGETFFYGATFVSASSSAAAVERRTELRENEKFLSHAHILNPRRTCV